VGAYKVVEIILDKTGDVIERVQLVIPDVEVTREQIETVLKGLKLGPYDSEGGIISVTVSEPVRLASFVTKRIERLAEEASDTAEAIRLLALLNRKLRELHALGLIEEPSP
jgi:hypothetical protein